MMKEREKSDPSIVAAKLANKSGGSDTESAEPRGGAKGNTPESRTGPNRIEYLREASRSKSDTVASPSELFLFRPTATLFKQGQSLAANERVRLCVPVSPLLVAQ